ncbi:PTS system lichenan oligosaccharide-specific IIA component, Lac family [Bacillus sp. OV166]|uniref:PTS lactose/cellobiose transporter subunit IIA n=1 Tax=unclassified Bacillus (in: firmicutes) TaxID=185979 RepID=UPI000A2AD1A5|nr:MULTISPECIES: PTS lactose/cellobiose transporter subunit IIA [unclassified Bacillus (in: firmicutes)]PGY13065.1 PTS lactose/cellobiose transporter subunit IIA [Bacillus sp. AFS031507]SMQ74046.1 PTS system lichenan oligosaccharide-specific IIA component, Lac family [Bacillus sp. OV166]
MENLEAVIFQIILHGGNGRSAAMEAMQAAKKGDFEGARQKLMEADNAMNEAHHIQTSLIQGEIRGEKTEISLLMVHAQDHLMNAMTVKDLAVEMVELYQRIK